MTRSEAALRDMAAIELATAKLQEVLMAARVPLADAIAAFRIAGSSDWLDDPVGRATYFDMAAHLDRLRAGANSIIGACTAIAANAASQDLLARTTLDRKH